MKTKQIVSAIFLLILSACAAPAPTATQPLEVTVPPTQTALPPEPTLPPALPTATATEVLNLATYTDDLAGFSLDYPADWFLEDSVLVHAQESYAYTVGIATWDLRNPPTPGGKQEDALPEGGTKIDVTVVKDPMTLDEAVAKQNDNELHTPILARKDVTLSGGLPAVILDVEGFAGLARTLISTLNGNVIYVSGYGNLEMFEPIALSLRAE
jgi:hypothetical protein